GTELPAPDARHQGGEPGGVEAAVLGTGARPVPRVGGREGPRPLGPAAGQQAGERETAEGGSQNVILAAICTILWVSSKLICVLESAPKFSRGFDRFSCGIKVPFVKLYSVSRCALTFVVLSRLKASAISSSRTRSPRGIRRERRMSTV